MAAGMNPIDLAGALQQYSAALQSGIGASNQALDAQMAALNTGGDGQRGALLQLAAGFLSPTRTGSFGESLGNAVGNYATADAQARQAQMDRALKLAQIQQARAKLMMEGAGSQFELAQKAYELQRQGQEDDLFSAFQTGGGTLQDAAAQASAGDMLGQRSLAPIMPATGAFDAPMMDAPVSRVNAVPQPLPEPAPAPMFPPRTAAELASADNTLNALRGTGGFGPDGFVDNPVLGAAMGRVLGTPPAPLDLPDQMLDPLTAPLMGPPASFGPPPAIPTSPQPLRRTPEADLPAAGANPAQARAGQAGFAIPGGDEQSLLSPSMTLSPQQAGQLRERAARMRGAREPAAPAAQGVDTPLGIPRPRGAYGRAYDDLTRMLGPEGQQLYARNPERAAALEKRLWDRLERSPDYQRALEMGKGTPDIIEYQFARSQGYDGSFTEFQNEGRRAGATQVNVGTGEPGAQSDKFRSELDKLTAQGIRDLSEAGRNAGTRLAQIDQLEYLLSESPQGAEGAFKLMLGEFGIATEGLDFAQAAQALINQLVPGQRPPGSGPMSDADLALFIRSMPRIINQPGANQLLIRAMRGIAQYDQRMGRIADKLAIDPNYNLATAYDEMAAVPNPLAWIRVMGRVPPQAVELLQSNPTPEIREQFDERFGDGMADRVLGR